MTSGSDWGSQWGTRALLGAGVVQLSLSIFVFYHFACLEEQVLELKSEIHLKK